MNIISAVAYIAGEWYRTLLIVNIGSGNGLPPSLPYTCWLGTILLYRKCFPDFEGVWYRGNIKRCWLLELFSKNIVHTLFKELCMVHCTFWDGKHEEAIRISQCTRCLAVNHQDPVIHLSVSKLKCKEAQVRHVNSHRKVIYELMIYTDFGTISVVHMHLTE